MSLTASYALGPGIQIDGVLEYDNYNGDEDARTSNGNFEGLAFGLGTLISF